MSDELRQALQQIEEMVADCDADWDKIKRQLDIARQRYRQPPQTREIQQLEQRIQEDREGCFQDMLQDVRERIAKGEIQNDQALNKLTVQLAMRARPRSARKDIEDLRRQWRDKGKLTDIERQVSYYIDQYRQAVAQDGWDFVEAEKEYLQKAWKLVEQAAQTIGNAIEINQLITRVRREIREADKTPLHTMATQQEFAEIIEMLRNKPENYRENLIDENGRYFDTLERDEAILWYQEKAIRFARERAARYLEEARKHLRRGQPLIALANLSDLETLNFRPEDIWQEAQDFRDNDLQKVIDRIDYARHQLQSVVSAQNVDQALQHFNNALDEQYGWDRFRLIAEQEANEAAQNGGTVVVNDYDDAVNHIINGMQQALVAYFEVIGKGNIWLPNDPDIEARIEQFERYLDFNNGQLRATYQAELANLRSIYHRQLREEKEITQQQFTANQRLEAQNYEEAYRILQPYEAVIEQHPEEFRYAASILQRAKSFLNRQLIYRQIEQRLQTGVNQQPVREQLADVEGLIKQGKAAQDASSDPQGGYAWDERINQLQDLRSLLFGEVAFEDDRISEALQHWQRVVFFVDHRDKRIQHAQRLIQDNEAMDKAMKQAQDIVDNDGDLRQAYNLLLPYQERRDTRHYIVWKEMFQNIHQRLVALQLAHIDQNIVNEPHDPGQLLQLASELEDLSESDYDSIDERINRALRLQTAHSDYALALPTESPGKWRRALNAWKAVPVAVRGETPRQGEELDADTHAQYLYDIQRSYTIVLVLDGLQQTEDDNVSRNQEVLNRLLTNDINQMQQEIQDNVLAEHLRFLIWVRLAELSETPEDARSWENKALGLSPRATDRILQELTPHYAERLEHIEQLTAVAMRLRGQLALGQPLPLWDDAVNRWQKATENVSQSLGLLRWFQGFVQERVQQLEAQIGEIGQKWQELLPLAKMDLLGHRNNTLDLKTYYDTLIAELRNLKSGQALAFTRPLAEQIDHINLLKDQAIALIFLIEGKIYNSYTPITLTTPISEKTTALIEETNDLRDTLDQLQLHLNLIADRTENAMTTGAFDTMQEQLTVFEVGGVYTSYRNHPEVTRAIAFYEESQHQYHNFAKIARSLEQAYTENNFGQVRSFADQLETDEAERYGADMMIDITDPYTNERITDTAQALAAVQAKEVQVEAIRKRLDLLVDTVRLLEFRRHGVEAQLLRANQVWFVVAQSTTDPASLKQIDIRVADYDTIKTQKATPDLRRARFKQVQEMLVAICNGRDYATGGDTTTYGLYEPENGTFSLRQALATLRGLLDTCPADVMRSHTAAWLRQWVETLRGDLEAVLQQAEAHIQQVEDQNTRYTKEKGAFMDAYGNLGKGGASWRRFSRNDALSQLRLSYHYITGRGQYGAACDPNDGDPALPLAPEYRALDAYYSEYAVEIEKRLEDGCG